MCKGFILSLYIKSWYYTLRRWETIFGIFCSHWPVKEIALALTKYLSITTSLMKSCNTGMVTTIAIENLCLMYLLDNIGNQWKSLLCEALVATKVHLTRLSHPRRHYVRTRAQYRPRRRAKADLNFQMRTVSRKIVEPAVPTFHGETRGL